MRVVIFGLVLVLAGVGAATAHECSGQGSNTYLTFDDWTISGAAKSQVELLYRLQDDKPATRLQAQVYFQSARGERIADAAITLVDAAGVSQSGQQSIVLDKQELGRLAGAEHDLGRVFACTNYIEYLDGSGTIID